MFENWSFGRKVGAASTITVLLTVVMAGFAIITIQDVVRSKDFVIEVHQQSLMKVLRLNGLVENHVNVNRGYLLTRDPTYLQERDRLETEVEQVLADLRGAVGQRSELVTAIASAMSEYKGKAREQQAAASNSLTLETAELGILNARPARQALSAAVKALIAAQEDEVALENERASKRVQSAVALVIGCGVVCSVLAVLCAMMLTRALGRQLHLAIQQMRSSSSELQAAAGQQASGLREQASAMTEVNTTINELQATSRQIADRAKRVAQLSTETVNGAHQGSTAVTRSKVALDGISRQVDQVVSYMLELGRKSQQIGLVLDLLSELAEQTNILAINATIEATGAGDAGRRFLVVADEIRKLADRVAGSTKEVRSLIEDVRSAVNTSVVASETGAKSVETGLRQFEELTRVFSQIVELVALVTEAAREIELSTKQQASAVEQVNIAVASVTQATREGEASSSQTLQTAAQLATLSKDLVRIVQAGAVN